MFIETPLKYLASTTGQLCYLAAYACAGGKLALGTGHKVAAFTMSFKDTQKADAWNKTGDEYLTSAKKTVIRDLKISSGLILTGFALTRFGTFETPIQTYSKAIGISVLLTTLFAIKRYAVALGAGHKVAAHAISFTDKQKADTWNKTGDEYLTSGKITAIHDLKITSGLILAGFAISIFRTFETLSESYGKAFEIPVLLTTLFAVHRYDIINYTTQKTFDRAIHYFSHPLFPCNFG